MPAASSANYRLFIMRLLQATQVEQTQTPRDGTSQARTAYS
jgi:hypothetical protein